ncbi:hypothetical protein HOE31_02975 [bacterium]|jgi:hypothetical protein|nr:hypothetical protein [bacterium]MBT4495344.1 hypothetical protein [bacterium]MBT4763737.1 hypothetical protein [bacterium]MBT5401107.1 hypothetical protein [bacterium]MBT5942932.1 hypothetical protein [bacterium]
MKKVIIIFILLITVVAIYLLMNNDSDQNELVNDKRENGMVVSNVVDAMPEEFKANFEDDILTDSDTEVASLVAVDSSESSGTAYRLVKDGKLYHRVVADLPDLMDNNKYEGWLVQKSPLKFFSTGVMEKIEDGKWFLEYQANNEYPTYLTIVITLETIVDTTPEKHIIEGDF